VAPFEKASGTLRWIWEKILCDHTSVPCAYCSVLMMSAAVKWVDYDPDETYDVTSCLSTTFAMEQ